MTLRTRPADAAALPLLNTPYGGALTNLLVPPHEQADLRAYASGLASVVLSDRSLCDLELLATGAFSPLTQFMGAADYARVLTDMRLADGTLWPMPLTLPIGDDVTVEVGQDVALRSRKNDLLGVMTVEEVYGWDLATEAAAVFGTNDVAHPTVAEMHRWGRRYVAGPLRVLELPAYYDFPEDRLTPAQTRARLAALGRANVVAFQTRNPLHRAHEELTKRAAAAIDGVLLLQPAVGMTKPGDVDHYTRVRSYRALVETYYDPRRVLLALLPLAMRMGGPREALWHAIIRRNYGASHFIVGRDHAGPGRDSTGQPFYGPYDAQRLVARHADEIGITVLPFEQMVYLPDDDRYEEAGRVPPGTPTWDISGTQVRQDYLSAGRPLPAWFTRPEVAAILAESYPARRRQGVCLWFTGLSGAGKSTTAEVLTVMLQAQGRQVTVLDGDVVRTHLSQGLGFSREDRDTNIRRIGFVAAEIVRHGGLVICAAISPYAATRADVRAMVGDNFVEIFVDTPLDVCEARDTKGLYARARRGEITGFTGLDDPYEPPSQPEITLDTVSASPQVNARHILDYLIGEGFVG